MIDNFEFSLLQVLRHEGGFVNHPADPGGMTNLGCTKKVWEEYVGHQVDEATMRALTPEKVAPLYKHKYWDAVHADELPDGIDFCVFDCAINSGPGRAIKLLQKAVGVTADGVMGPGTMAAIGAYNPVDVVAKFSAERLGFLQSLPTFSTFGKGWSHRVAEVQHSASDLAA